MQLFEKLSRSVNTAAINNGYDPPCMKM